MSDLDHEKEFEAFLSHRARVRAGLAGNEGLEPPEELDRIVLAQAREAIRLPRSTRFYTPSRWALPMGLAATVVLTFTVMLHFGLLPKPIKEEAAALEAHLTESAEAPREAHSESMVSASPASPEVNIDVPMPTRSIGESERAQPTLHRRKLLERLRTEQAIASSSTNRPAPMAAPPAPGASAPAADMAASKADETPPSTAETAASGAFSSVVVTGARAPAREERAVDKTPEDPAQWLERIGTLRAQGKTEDADREWLAFRKAWPHYPVTADQNR